MKALLVKQLSLSCVENYYLAWLQSRGIDTTPLFSRSYIPAHTVLQDYVCGDAKYEYYPKIPRVMTVGGEYDITGRHVKFAFCPEFIDRMLNEGSLVLMEVNPEYFENASRAPWRRDHYIWLTGKIGGRYTTVNNYPLSESELDEKDIEKYFGNKILVYRIGKRSHVFSVNDIERQLTDIVYLPKQSFDIKTENLKTVRDAVGTLKTTRLRLKRWFKYAADSGYLNCDVELEDFMSEYCQWLEKIYVAVEAAILRRKEETFGTQELIGELIRQESAMGQAVKMRRIIDERLKYD